MRLPSKWILLLIVFVEGFAVLAAELLAIRQIIPYVGSGTDTVSILIAAVLLPLAVGNFMGGRFVAGAPPLSFIKSVREKLIFNLLIAMAFLIAGLSYATIKLFFEEMLFMGIGNRHVLSTLYAAAFLIIPVYLLGQTLPLISHYFSKDSIQKTTGKMLFFSTAGSFMGSVFCTLVLMATIGVHNTVIVVIAALCALVFILSKKIVTLHGGIAAALVLVALTLNHGSLLTRDNVIANNEYHLIQLEEDGETRTLKLNGNTSSRTTTDPQKRLAYERYINTVFFKPIEQNTGTPKDILMIGAGGFMLGIDDTYNNITYVDIDAELLAISEEKFLKMKLTDNKVFEAVPARAYLTKALQNGKQYDMIVLDLFQGNTSLPEHLITQEFYYQVYDTLKDGGIMAGNFYLSPHFSDALSRRIDNTMRSVFGNLNRQIMVDHNAWFTDPNSYQNIIYSAYKIPKSEQIKIYTDQLNPSFYDKNRGVKD